MTHIVQIGNVYYPDYSMRKVNNKGTYNSNVVTNLTEVRQGINATKVLEFVDFMKQSADEILRNNKPFNHV